MAQKKPLLFLGGLWALVDVLRFACKLVDGKAGFVIGSAPFAQFPEGFESYFFFFYGFLNHLLAERGGHLSVELIPIGVFYPLVGRPHDTVEFFPLGGIVIYLLVVTFLEGFPEPLEDARVFRSYCVEVGKELSFDIFLAHPGLLTAWAIVIAVSVPVTLLNFPRNHSAASFTFYLRLEYGEVFLVLRIVV